MSWLRLYQSSDIHSPVGREQTVQRVSADEERQGLLLIHQAGLLACCCCLLSCCLPSYCLLSCCLRPLLATMSQLVDDVQCLLVRVSVRLIVLNDMPQNQLPYDLSVKLIFCLIGCSSEKMSRFKFSRPWTPFCGWDLSKMTMTIWITTYRNGPS